MTVVVQAETAEAVQNIEAIARVPGLDAVFVGPYDLSASLGHPGEVDHPEVRAAIGRVSGAAGGRGPDRHLRAGAGGARRLGRRRVSRSWRPEWTPPCSVPPRSSWGGCVRLPSLRGGAPDPAGLRTAPLTHP